MKRLIAYTACALLAACAFAAKAKLTVKNTAGADLDEVGDYDLVTHTNETDINDDTQRETAFAFGDRLQADYESALVTARARLELLYTSADEAEAKLLFVPSGYAHVMPVPQFGVVAGTNFYKRFAVPSAYLAAADDTTKYGRLLTDSLGAEHYFGSDSAAVFANGVAGGVTSDWLLGGRGYAKLAGGATVYPDGADTEKAVDFGVNAGVQGAFDAGFTAHNVTEDDRKFGAFVGLTAVPNLILNAHFYYNFTTSDYLPEERVTGSDDDDNDVYKYKKQSTKYALGVSGGYKFKSGFGVYADAITGLTNEYIGKIKYYDSDGNLIDTKTATVVRGATIVKYKNGKAKRNDKFTHEGIPFYSQLRLTYDISDSVAAACNVKLRSLLGASDTTWLTFYPRVAVDLPQSAGTIGAGVRLDMNAARYSGISSISVPLTYTYKFKKKFK